MALLSSAIQAITRPLNAEVRLKPRIIMTKIIKFSSSRSVRQHTSTGKQLTLVDQVLTASLTDNQDIMTGAECKEKYAGNTKGRTQEG